MKRRTLLLAGGGWLAATAVPATGQSPAQRIGVLIAGSEAGFRNNYDAFIAALRGHGHAAGPALAIDVRWAEDRPEALPKLAAELVALRPDVILTASSAGIAALQKATTSVPVVFATAFEPVEQGFVRSLQRPGGNITGVIVHRDLTAKLIELTREALPNARRLGFLVYEPDPVHKRMVPDFEASAKRYKFEPLIVRLRAAGELERAFSELAARKVHAVVLPQLTFFVSVRREVARQAIRAKLPLLSVTSNITEVGGLFSYGTDPVENYRRAASLVDKILRGARPADLPVEQPERFLLVVNRTTAGAIGVALSPVTMLRVDRIVD